MKRQSIAFFLISAISLICLFVLRLLLGGWVDYLWVPLVLFVASFIAGLWGNLRFFKEFFTLKTTKEGMSMGALIALMLVLLAAVNYLGVKKYKTFDFTAGKVNTLSEQSITILKNLKSDLNIIYFYQEGSQGVEQNKRSFIDLVKKYQDQSDRVKLQFVEVNKEPKLAAEYAVDKGSGLVYVTYEGRKNKIEKIDEQELTGAIVKAMREKDKNIYHIIGHGERIFDDSQELAAVSLFRKMLEGNRYTVKPLNLVQSPQVPADADVVVVAGPTQNFLASEVTALENYLKAGGHLFVALEVGKEVGLESLLKKIGFKINNQYIAQVVQTQMGLAVNPQVTPVNEFSVTNAITKPFGRAEFVVMRLPAILERVTPPPAGITIDDFVRTGTQVAAFTDLEFKSGGTPGPFTVASLATGSFGKESDQGKVFKATVFTDVDFLSNQFLYKNLNRDLALNSISYLAGEETLISITPKEVGVTQMTITDTQWMVFVLGFLIPVPLLLIIASGVIWYRRRYA